MATAVLSRGAVRIKTGNRQKVRGIQCGWTQDPTNKQCPKCKNYTWYTDGKGNYKCNSCGFTMGP